MEYTPQLQTIQSDELSRCLDILREKACIAIIYSGDNRQQNATLNATYHPRHWKSYQGVAEDIRETLLENGFRKVITLQEDINLVQEINRHKIDLAWLNTGGLQGRNAMAHAASLLEMAGIPYVGHSPLNYALLDHKLDFKTILRGLGLPTADYIVWDPARHSMDPRAFLKELHATLGPTDMPWVVKPVNGRGSQYIFTPSNEASLMEAIEEVYAYTQNRVLIETFLPGRELCVAGGPRVMVRNGTPKALTEPMAFACMEKIIHKDEFIFSSLDRRPIDGARARSLDPVSDATTIDQLKKLCRKVCTTHGLQHLIRLDLREDKDGIIRIMEANPKPDLKRPREGGASLVAMGLASIDLSYADLLHSILASSLYHDLNFRPASLPGLKKLFGPELSTRKITGNTSKKRDHLAHGLT